MSKSEKAKTDDEGNTLEIFLSRKSYCGIDDPYQIRLILLDKSRFSDFQEGVLKGLCHRAK